MVGVGSVFLMAVAVEFLDGWYAVELWLKLFQSVVFQCVHMYVNVVYM